MHAVIHDDEASLRAANATPRIAAARLAAGLAQGLALYWLYRAFAGKSWPADVPALFYPLLLTFFLLPPLLITALGYLRSGRLLAWLLAAGAVLAMLALYGVRRGAPWESGDPVTAFLFDLGSPMTTLFPAASAVLFVAHALVMGGAAHKRLLADYRAYFEAAWKLAIQLAFAAAFALGFWLLLVLGGFLLMLVQVELLQTLSRASWFLVPGMAVACACALHVTDARPGIVRSIRSLALALLSWLLPLAALITVGFLSCLPWTGMAPLWATRHAAVVLIGMSLVLLLLINAAYQDGNMAARMPLPIRASARAAALCLPALAAIAAHALALRVGQHGWTSERIVAAVCLLLLAVHATGYAWSALRGHGMDGIARVNIAGAFLFVALLLALLSPLADPARLAVASQLARLESGRVEASRFDFVYLREHGARYGRAALERLQGSASGPDAETIRRKAAQALHRPAQPGMAGGGPLDLAPNLRVLPEGARLPSSFLSQDWSRFANRWLLPSCLREAGRQCDAFVIDVYGDGKPEVLLLGSARDPLSVVLAQAGDGNGTWRPVLRLPLLAAGCDALRAALAAGNYRLLPHAGRDLEILGERVPLEPYGEQGQDYSCPAPRQ